MLILECILFHLLFNDLTFNGNKIWSNEYKTFTSTGGLRIAVEESSSLGQDGWELVTINYCNDYREWVFTYKRHKE